MNVAPEDNALVEMIKKDEEVEAPPAAPFELESKLATHPILAQANFDEIMDNKEDYTTSQPVLAPEPSPPIQPQVDGDTDETMQKEEHFTGENDPTIERKEEAVDVIVTETYGNDEDMKLEGNNESTEVIGNEKSLLPNASTVPKKKRVRRVGKTPTRKMAKLNEGSTPMSVDTHVLVEGTTIADANGISAAAAAAAASTEGIKSTEPAENDIIIGATLDTLGDIPNQSQRVLSKHDEKWNAMFVKLLEFKEKNKNTLVPQCYTDDQRLGRWVHYQRVEYWIFQQTETAKITEERIGRLDAIDFEWDPQKAQWDKIFEKLKEYKKENNHCRVPKGYEKDWELANWVRNQRLEQANLSKLGKKSRMTPERFKLLDDLGFKWSIATPARANRNSEKKKSKVEEQNKASKMKLEEVPVDNSESMMAVEGQVPTCSNDTFADTFLPTLPTVANEAIATETIAQSAISENPEENVCIDVSAVSAEHVAV